MKKRVTLEHVTSKEERTVILPIVTKQSWKIKQVLRSPQRPVSELNVIDLLVENNDAELERLVVLHKLGGIPQLLDKARAKFGTNISVAGLILQIKARGL